MLTQEIFALLDQSVKKYQCNNGDDQTNQIGVSLVALNALFDRCESLREDVEARAHKLQQFVTQYELKLVPMKIESGEKEINRGNWIRYLGQDERLYHPYLQYFALSVGDDNSIDLINSLLSNHDAELLGGVLNSIPILQLAYGMSLIPKQFCPSLVHAALAHLAVAHAPASTNSDRKHGPMERHMVDIACADDYITKRRYGISEELASSTEMGSNGSEGSLDDFMTELLSQLSPQIKKIASQKRSAKNEPVYKKLHCVANVEPGLMARMHQLMKKYWKETDENFAASVIDYVARLSLRLLILVGADDSDLVHAVFGAHASRLLTDVLSMSNRDRVAVFLWETFALHYVMTGQKLTMYDPSSVDPMELNPSFEDLSWNEIIRKALTESVNEHQILLIFTAYEQASFYKEDDVLFRVAAESVLKRI